MSGPPQMKMDSPISSRATWHGAGAMSGPPQIKVAIVKLSSLGDVIHALPVARALRRGVPRLHLTWIVEAREYALLDGHPDLDVVMPVDGAVSCPSACTWTGSVTTKPVSRVMCTAVRSGKVAGPAPGVGPPSARQASTRNSTGTASAVSLSQYWNAWTKVMLRMPPATTLTSTTTATRAAPTQVGAPVTARRVSPAPWNCGTR